MRLRSPAPSSQRGVPQPVRLVPPRASTSVLALLASRVGATFSCLVARY